MIVETSRLLVTLTTTAVGFIVGRSLVSWFPTYEFDTDFTTVTGALVGAGVGYVLGGVLGRFLRRALDRAPSAFSGSAAVELFAGGFGALVGMALSMALAVPLVVLLPVIVGWPLASMVVLIATAFGARVFGSRGMELLSAFGAQPIAERRPAADDESAPTRYIVDSAAAIDGRILELARADLLTGEVWAPEFVVDELQAIADAQDKSRRRRGRRGLEILDAIRDVESVNFSVQHDSIPEHSEVDAKLIALAAKTGAKLVTTDHNLQQAAGLRGIVVVNPHALGESMRPSVLTGDRVEITVEREGSEPGQGVGYLDDGTMVVLEDGAGRLGETVEVEVANSLRTSVGRLVFAKLTG